MSSRIFRLLRDHGSILSFGAAQVTRCRQSTRQIVPCVYVVRVLPKRFAQLMGAVMSSLALVLGLVAGDHTAADVVLGLFAIAAGLESLAGYCLGCKAFGLLMRAGLVPEEVCAECADISLRLRAGTRSP